MWDNRSIIINFTFVRTDAMYDGVSIKLNILKFYLMYALY